MSESHEHEVWQLLDKMQMDLRDLNAKMTALRGQVAALKLPAKEQHRCEACKWNFSSLNGLQTHFYYTHGGALPEAWAKAEAMAVDDAILAICPAATESEDA